MNIYRFLCDLQYQGLQTNFSLDLSHYFPDLSFYPRVTYKGAILSLACWKLTSRTLAGDEPANERGKLAALRQNFKQKGVPRYFASYQGDQQLIYDLESEQDMLTLLNMFHTTETVSIKEFPFPLHESSVTDSCGGKYLEQYLTALLHPQEVYKSDISEQLSAAQFYEVSRDTDDWLYLKVYCHAGNCPFILQNIMTAVNDKLVTKGYTDRYFYVVYLDPGYHLRLRFRCTDPEYKPSVISLLEQILLPLSRKGIISAISMDYYQRELERYAPANMGTIEAIFSLDTSWIMSSIASKGLSEVGFIEVTASVALLLEAFQLTLDEKLAQCNLVYDSLFAEFRGDKALRLSLDKKHRMSKELWKQKYAITENLLQDNEYYKSMSALIHELIKNCVRDAQNQMVKMRLCSDIAHMHMNRIFLERPREQEMIVYFLLLQYYKSLKYHE